MSDIKLPTVQERMQILQTAPVKFAEALEQDPKLAELRKAIAEIYAKAYPLQQQAQSEQKRIAVETHFVFKTKKSLEEFFPEFEFANDKVYGTDILVYVGKAKTEVVPAFLGLEFYRCRVCDLILPKDSLREEEYNDLGPLCGSAGTRYSCGYCNIEIGRDERVVS